MAGFLLIIVLVFFIVGLPIMIMRQNDYAEYVKECERKGRLPMNYTSWKKSTGRGGLL